MARKTIKLGETNLVVEDATPGPTADDFGREIADRLEAELRKAGDLERDDLHSSDEIQRDLRNPRLEDEYRIWAQGDLTRKLFENASEDDS